MEYSLPRLVIAAAQSGSGKTTVATGLLSALRQRGIVVQSFKVGPDYIDPGYHRLASGRAAHNLDTWLVPKERVPALFAQESAGADIAVVEGVMGLYDGGREGVSSTAEIAKLLKAPVILVIDAKSMGASAAALAMGFRDYDPEVQLAGVILNRLGSKTHEAMIRQAMKEIDMPVLGALYRNEELHMPERHLGLLPAEENTDREIVEALGNAVAGSLDLEAILHLACLTPELLTCEQPAELRGASETVCRIGIARDEAFSFYYPASLKELESLGAELVPFSPLHDKALPDVDGLFIGGGFPEMFAEKLSGNEAMRNAIRAAAEKGMPISAECGGYMYLMQELQDFDGRIYPMCGVFAGKAAMTRKLQMVGYVDAVLQQATILGPAGTSIHGHEFHFSQEEGDGSEDGRPFVFTKMRNGSRYPAGQCHKQALGSYLHLHFAGCPEAAEHFVEACRQWER